MIGKTNVYGCAAPLGGWWTDLQKAARSGMTTAAQALSLWQQGQLTESQYLELQKTIAEASGKTSDNTKTILYVGGALVALVALGVLSTGRKKG